MFTVITKGNNVSQRWSVTYGDIDHIIVVNESGMVRVDIGNPITWPIDATDGMQAIVDVKAGTLRFGYDGWPRSATEFVVSEYSESFVPFVSVEDSAPVHVLDHITGWPEPEYCAFLQGKVFDNWRFLQEQGGGPWILRNDKENVEFHKRHWLNYHENKKKQTAPHIFDIVNYWPQQHPHCHGTNDLPEGWEWKWFGDDWILSNRTIGLKREDWLKYNNKQVAAQPAQPQVTAASMLTAALGHMEDRAKTYDAPGGERSMGKTVAAFNVITGLVLTEEQGWLFMEILKQVRSQQGDYRADNYADMVAYAALRGECAARERGDKSC